MGNSKVIFGNETLIDLTGDTVTSDTLLAGTTAHNRSGEQIVGAVTVPSALDDLTDVDITSPTTDQVLKFDGSKWVNGNGGGGGADALDDLTDVTITSPAEGDLLQRNGNGEWANSAKIPQKVAGLQKTGCINVLPNYLISQVVSGVTLTVNNNGIITADSGGSAAASNVLVNMLVRYNVGAGNTHFLPNGTYKLLGSNNSRVHLSAFITKNGAYTPLAKTNSADGAVFTVNGDDSSSDGAYVGVSLLIDQGDAISNVVIKPMITPDLSATYDDYQPYSMTNRELTEAAARAITVDKNWAFTGTFSTLTDNTTFKCPEDGYLYIQMPRQSTGEVRLVYDGGNALFSETVLPSPDVFFKRVVFLRKGLKIKYEADGATPAYARFYPIV